MTNRKIEYWVIPPEADGEFVAHMEEVLETYAQPHNPEVPVICMDECETHFARWSVSVRSGQMEVGAMVDRK